MLENRDHLGNQNQALADHPQPMQGLSRQFNLSVFTKKLRSSFFWMVRNRLIAIIAISIGRAAAPLLRSARLLQL